MFSIRLKIGSNSKLVRLKTKREVKTDGFHSMMVQLERLFQTTLRQFYHGIVPRVKTFFKFFDFWIALQSLGLQCKSA